jgi:hypothetical protein
VNNIVQEERTICPTNMLPINPNPKRRRRRKTTLLNDVDGGGGPNNLPTVETDVLECVSFIDVRRSLNSVEPFGGSSFLVSDLWVDESMPVDPIPSSSTVAVETAVCWNDVCVANEAFDSSCVPANVVVESVQKMFEVQAGVEATHNGIATESNQAQLDNATIGSDQMQLDNATIESDQLQLRSGSDQIQLNEATIGSDHMQLRTGNVNRN